MYKPKFITNLVESITKSQKLKQEHKKYKDLVDRIIDLVDDEFTTSRELRHKLEDLLIEFDSRKEAE